MEKKYDSTLKAKRNYNKSERGKMTREEWLKTEEGKKSIQEANAKYTETKRKDWLNTESGKNYLERDRSVETRARRSNVNSEIMEFIKDVRKNSGLKQDEFADKLGVSINLVRKWELGENRPNFEVAQRMAFAFNFKSKLLIGLIKEAEKKAEMVLKEKATNK